jgi:hypothetical protein
VDRELRAVVANDRPDLEQIGIASWSEVQARVVFLVVDAHRVRCGMVDVLV